MLFKEATDLLSLDLKRIAERTGRSYPTVAAYRSGDREPTSDVLRMLAAFMQEHATAVAAMAESVIAEADRLDEERQLKARETTEDKRREDAEDRLRDRRDDELRELAEARARDRREERVQGRTGD